MLSTEDEARTKWCPMTRIAWFNSGSNRFLDIEAPGTEKHRSACRCIASECMAWRWGASQAVPGGRVDRGFCGLSGTGKG